MNNRGLPIQQGFTKVPMFSFDWQPAAAKKSKSERGGAGATLTLAFGGGMGKAESDFCETLSCSTQNLTKRAGLLASMSKKKPVSSGKKRTMSSSPNGETNARQSSLVHLKLLYLFVCPFGIVFLIQEKRANYRAYVIALFFYSCPILRYVSGNSQLQFIERDYTYA
jgi:hypothetical protein